MEREILIKFREELTCPLCHRMFENAHLFPGCNHAFCYECVLHTLEGPGVTASECPICKQPGWKRELIAVHTISNLASSLRSALQQTGIPLQADPEQRKSTAKEEPADTRGVSSGSHRVTRSSKQARQSGQKDAAAAGTGGRRKKRKSGNGKAREECSANEEAADALPERRSSRKQVKFADEVAHASAEQDEVAAGAADMAAGMAEIYEEVPNTYPVGPDGCEVLFPGQPRTTRSADRIIAKMFLGTAAGAEIAAQLSESPPKAEASASKRTAKQPLKHNPDGPYSGPSLSDAAGKISSEGDSAQQPPQLPLQQDHGRQVTTDMPAEEPVGPEEQQQEQALLSPEDMLTVPDTPYAELEEGQRCRTGAPSDRATSSPHAQPLEAASTRRRDMSTADIKELGIRLAKQVKSPKTQAEVEALELQATRLQELLAKVQLMCRQRGLLPPAEADVADLTGNTAGGARGDHMQEPLVGAVPQGDPLEGPSLDLGPTQLEGTERSLADIDEAMRARGFRLSLLGAPV